jgi:hypothetical protein
VDPGYPGGGTASLGTSEPEVMLLDHLDIAFCYEFIEVLTSSYFTEVTDG